MNWISTFGRIVFLQKEQENNPPKGAK